VVSFAKPGLTRLELVYVHLTKAKPIHKIQTYPLVRNDFDHKGSVEKSQVLSLKGLDARISDWG
jgi:hypothetical protein